jgi:hypothetical protein
VEKWEPVFRNEDAATNIWSGSRDSQIATAVPARLLAASIGDF